MHVDESDSTRVEQSRTPLLQLNQYRFTLRPTAEKWLPENTIGTCELRAGRVFSIPRIVIVELLTGAKRHQRGSRAANLTRQLHFGAITRFNAEPTRTSIRLQREIAPGDICDGRGDVESR